MNRLLSLVRTLLLLALPLLSVQAQAPANLVGRWIGSLDLGGVKLGLSVNLAQKSANEWTGRISIPAQAMTDAALSNVTVKDGQVSFALPEVPGSPTFTGKLAPDSQTITGELTQSGKTFPFRLARESKETAARFGATPAKGVAGAGLVGEWQGALDAGAMTLRLIFRITKAADDSFVVLLDSPDQSVMDVKADSATSKEKTLRCEWKRLGAVYEGALNQDGSEITGEFQQGGATLPLTLKRLAQSKP